MAQPVGQWWSLWCPAPTAASRSGDEANPGWSRHPPGVPEDTLNVLFTA